MNRQEENIPLTNHIKIVKKDAADTTYKVDNIYIDRSIHGNTVDITWHSDDTEFEIWFPVGQNPVTNLIFLRRFTLRSKGKSITKKLNNLKNLKAGTYYYSIHCKQAGPTGTMAEGNSPPRMIIK